MNFNYFIECNNCKYKINGFKFGQFYFFANIDDIIRMQTEFDKNTISNIYKKIHTFYSKGYSLYQCLKCNSLDNKYHLLLYNKQGDCIFETESFCKNCNQLRDYISFELANRTIDCLKCLGCNKKNHVIKVNF